MNISLTQTEKDFIKEQVRSGNHRDKSEVIRHALRLYKLYKENDKTTLQPAFPKVYKCGNYYQNHITLTEDNNKQ